MLKYIVAILLLLILVPNQAQAGDRDYSDTIINNYYGAPLPTANASPMTINNVYGLNSSALAAGMAAGDTINFDPNSQQTQIGGGVGFHNSYIGFAAAIGKKVDNTFYNGNLIKLEGVKDPVVGVGFVRNF
jgi:hypothetical protein